MDLEPVFQAAADTLRAIPRSELLIAALAAMALLKAIAWSEKLTLSPAELSIV